MSGEGIVRITLATPNKTLSVRILYKKESKDNNYALTKFHYNY